MGIILVQYEYDQLTLGTESGLKIRGGGSVVSYMRQLRPLALLLL